MPSASWSSTSTPATASTSSHVGARKRYPEGRSTPRGYASARIGDCGLASWTRILSVRSKRTDAGGAACPSADWAGPSRPGSKGSRESQYSPLTGRRCRDLRWHHRRNENLLITLRPSRQNRNRCRRHRRRSAIRQARLAAPLPVRTAATANAPEAEFCASCGSFLEWDWAGSERRHDRASSACRQGGLLRRYCQAATPATGDLICANCGEPNDPGRNSVVGVGRRLPRLPLRPLLLPL